MTAQTYRSTLTEKCNSFMRPKVPVKVKIKSKVGLSPHATKRELLLEQLKSLGVTTYKVGDGPREIIDEAAVGEL